MDTIRKVRKSIWFYVFVIATCIKGMWAHATPLVNEIEPPSILGAADLLAPAKEALLIDVAAASSLSIRSLRATGTGVTPFLLACDGGYCDAEYEYCDGCDGCGGCGGCDGCDGCGGCDSSC